MAAGISKDELAFLAAKAGVKMTEAQSADLMAIYPMIAAMTERNRSARGRQAEPGLIFVPGEGEPV